MQDSLKRFSPAVFAIAVASFMLPWVIFTSLGQSGANFTGLQMVTGTRPTHEEWVENLEREFNRGAITREIADQMAEAPPPRFGYEPLAVVVLFAAVLGVALSFLKGRKSTVMASIAGLVASFLLLLLKSEFQTSIARESNGVIRAEMEGGYWLVLILFLCAIALNGYLYFSTTGEVQTTNRTRDQRQYSSAIHWSASVLPSLPENLRGQELVWPLVFGLYGCASRSLRLRALGCRRMSQG